MSEKRRGLGRGLGALIPPAPAARPAGPRPPDRPVDVFFAEREDGEAAPEGAPDVALPITARDSIASKNAQSDTLVAEKPESSDKAGAEPEQPADDLSIINTDASTTQVAGTSGPELVPVPGAYFAELPVDSITANRKQPRQVFDEEALAELIHSVREIGVLQPIVVRALPAGDPAAADGQPHFELIMGERRWRASQAAGLERIPAIVRDTSDDDLLRDALLENLHRSDLNPLEEAAAYQQLLEDFGCTHEELATRIGRSRPQISNTIRLLRLPPAVQRRVAAGVLSAGHARALLGLDDADAMDKLAQRIVAEGLSVRATEEAVAISDSDSPTPAPRRRPRAGGHHAELDDLATRLADRLDTRVNISLGRNKGKISVEFASVEDLNRILALLAPEERKAFQGQE
jgi:ParB family transcriptional regulator, chromosome partitioning protein